MASLAELIAQQVVAATGKVEIPSNAKSQVVDGLSKSIIGSLTQTASSAGGVDIIKNLLSGKQSAASSPVTALAGKMFSNQVLGSLGLGEKNNKALESLVPSVVSKLSGIIKDQDGDGDVDFKDILLTLQGGSNASLFGAASSILGKLMH